MKKLKVSAICKAIYTGTIEVPDDLKDGDVMAYAMDHLNDVPVDELTFLSDTDELQDVAIIER